MGAKCSRHENHMVPCHYVLGLKGTGKTTIVQRLDKKERGLGNGPIPRDFPPEFFNDDDEDLYDHWYIGGRDFTSKRIRYQIVVKESFLGLIFVFDSTDVEKLDEAVAQLKQFIYVTSESEGTVIMILASKQDIDGAVSPEHIEAKVKEGCDQTFDNSLFVMPCCAVSGSSLLVAYDYFVEQSKKRQEGDLPLGLIPSAWEKANKKELNGTEKRNSSMIVHEMKKSAFKNPFKALKAALFF